MSLELIAALLVLGACTGYLAGLLGIGGGMVLTPFLTLILSMAGVPDAVVVHAAIATSLSTILFTSLSSVRAHNNRGAGTGIGSVSSLVGAGGGFISVPFMVWCNVPMHKAVGTSAALGFPIAFAGTLSYIWAGWGNPELAGTEHMLGYIHWPALLSVAAMSVLTAPLGAKTAHSIDTKPLKRIFACLLLCLATYMLVRAFI